MDLPKLEGIDEKNINTAIKEIEEREGWNDIARRCGDAIVEVLAQEEKVKNKEEELLKAKYELAKAQHKVDKLSKVSFLMKRLVSRKIKKDTYEAEIAMLLFPRK